ncbi:MAG: hypothetical protein ACXABD_12755, partial [Candidatus Thorarchaeota archaeon]
ETWSVVRLSWKQELVQISQAADGRVSPAFGPHHTAVVLNMIGREQPLGRYDICARMSIGEGSVRTLLKRLSESGYIIAEGKQGQVLTLKRTGSIHQSLKRYSNWAFVRYPRYRGLWAVFC